jgi:hypothetical protein
MFLARCRRRPYQQVPRRTACPSLGFSSSSSCAFRHPGTSDAADSALRRTHPLQLRAESLPRSRRCNWQLGFPRIADSQSPTKGNLPLDAFFLAAEQELRDPAVVGIVGSSALNGICAVFRQSAPLRSVLLQLFLAQSLLLLTASNHVQACRFASFISLPCPLALTIN